MNQTALYLMLIGLSPILVFSGASSGTIPAALQAIGGVLAIGSGGILLREVFSYPTNDE